MQQPLKIVHIIDTLDAGGAEKVLVTLCNILAAKGHQVTVITILHNGTLRDQLLPAIKVLCLQRTSKWKLHSMRTLVHWCRPFDVVHVHSSHNLKYLFVAGKLFGLRQHIFFHEHFGNIEIDKSIRWFHKLMYPATTLIAVSRKIYEWAVQDLKMDERKVFLLPNIVSYIPNNNSRQPDNVWRLLITSNFRPTKHLEFALQLVAAIRQTQAVHLTMVGQPVDTTYYNHILQTIQNLNIKDVVTINHDCNNIQTITHQFDAALHTARSESGPLVLIEYMAQGLPFLSFQTGEVIHQVQALLPECVVADFDVTRWQQQLQQLLRQDKTTLSQKLQAVYQQFYSEEAYYQQVMHIYSNGQQ